MGAALSDWMTKHPIETSEQVKVVSRVAIASRRGPAEVGRQASPQRDKREGDAEVEVRRKPRQSGRFTPETRGGRRGDQ